MPTRVSTEAMAPVMREAPDHRRPMPLIEITLPNGCTLRVDQHVDGNALRRILAALGG